LRKVQLHVQILAGMIIGIVAGIIVRYSGFSDDQLAGISYYVKPIGDIFLRLIFMTVIPLVLAALAIGVADLGKTHKLGRIGLKIFLFSLIVSSIAVVMGVGLTNLIKPGNSLTEKERTELKERFHTETAELQKTVQTAPRKDWVQTVVSIFPKNPIEDMSRAFDNSYTGGGLLAVMVFALIMGGAMAVSDQEKIKTFRLFLEGMYEVVMKIIGFAMRFAPLGIMALLFVLTVNMGWSILSVLLKYVLLVLGALAFHQFVTYSIILRYFAGRNPLQFFASIKDVMITAFSTSSSNATLPTAIKASIEKLGISKDVTNFTLTIGSTGNQHGTALYEGITILFIAQCFGVELSLAKQFAVVGISIVAGMGTAGVPGGSMAVMMVILESLGIKGENIALIYGVDRILDMSRTVLNVTGDLTAAAYIQYSEDKRTAKTVTEMP
jgi:DAACS family dicarboxylate/amino acid:cation (Na+ or H+) symporter